MSLGEEAPLCVQCVVDRAVLVVRDGQQLVHAPSLHRCLKSLLTDQPRQTSRRSPACCRTHEKIRGSSRTAAPLLLLSALHHSWLSMVTPRYWCSLTNSTPLSRMTSGLRGVPFLLRSIIISLVLFPLMLSSPLSKSIHQHLCTHHPVHHAHNQQLHVQKKSWMVEVYWESLVYKVNRSSSGALQTGSGPVRLTVAGLSGSR